MKIHNSYFQKKNSKQGLALSTAMAICIVLSILVALLVSMSTLNITTTQATVSQREAYIQAKSAIAFAESYYKTNEDQIPGNADGGVTGEGLFVFNDATVSNGASVYVTKVDSTDKMSATDVQDLKDNCPDTYVEVLNTGSQLDLTAYCKYGDGNAYKLSREYTLKTDFESRGNSYTGNVLYSMSSDSRYLRIHVRANDVFDGEPYLYTWYNDSASPGNVGSSQFVNKLTGDAAYGTLHPNGVGWTPRPKNADGTPDMSYPREKLGPTGKCAMEYEGNGWYVAEFTFGTSERITYLSAIITKPYALRSEGMDQQSWEFFGIPVPEETGEANGADVYISLNQNKLQDAQNSSRDPRDDLTYYFEKDCHASMNEFAQFSSKWYTVYTKQDTVTVHYRKQDVTDDSCGIGGFDYEGYGWWRDTTSSLGNSVTVAGTTYSYSDSRAAVISQNEYGRERVTELFICEANDGTSEAFGTEAEANDWFVSMGDTKAGDYVTVNVKAIGAPVDSEVPTKISYKSTIVDGGSALPTPGDTTSTDTETDVDVSGKEELVFAELANNITQPSGGHTDNNYFVVGTFNNWGKGDGTTATYENTQMMQTSNEVEYSYTYTDMPAGHYEYKIVFNDENTALSNEIEWDVDHQYYDGGGYGNFVIDTTVDGDITIVLKFMTGTSDSYSIDVIKPHGGTGSSNRYTVIGWMNDWGRVGGTGDHFFENTNEMTNNGDGTYTYVESNVAGGQTVTFKVMEMLADSGNIDTMGGWDNAWGGTGTYGDAEGNFSLPIGGSADSRWNVTINFSEDDKSISVNLDEIALPDQEYYLVGTFNNFADHTFTTAQGYKMELTGTDGNNNPIYKYNIGLQEPDTISGYELKVVSSLSECEPDVDGKTINYDYSWGAADSAGVTQGSDKAALSYTLSHRSFVEVTFTYNKADPTKSKITYLPIELGDTDTDIVSGKVVGFYNDQLTNINDPSQKTDFNTPWTEVYATYRIATGMNITAPVTEFDSNHMAWLTVPSDATEVYFSNMPMEDRGKPGYEYTETLTAAQLKAATSPVFFPISSTDDATGKKWTMGDTDEYVRYTSSSSDVDAHDVSMVYTGTSQVNYYDAPMVKVLEELVGGSGNYAFSCHKYSHYDNTPAGTIYFDGSHGSVGEVKYQGETYYYVPVSYEYSFMIMQTQDRSKGNIILENHFANLSGSTANRYGSGWVVDMDNRAGATFTSSGQYYDGTTSPNDFGGYAPNWYTYKIPTNSKFTITDIDGVVTDSTEIIHNNTQSITPVKAATHYNQPIYVFRNASGRIQYFTYDTSMGNVDTSPSLDVSVYFDNSEGWNASSIKVHAYSAVGGSTDETLSIDGTSADNNYYKFTFEEGKYCYFVFYDSSTGDWQTATKKTDVLYLTGDENEDREYQILAHGSATEFSHYLHPKTAALYAYQEVRSAVKASTISGDYTYSGGEYIEGASRSMLEIEAQEAAAKNYAEHGTGGKWSRSASADYADLANAARAFVNAISSTRVYIADDPTTGSSWIFPEYELKDDIIVYEERWVNTLRSIYSQAMSVYNTPSQQNAAQLWYWADELNIAIANPQSRISDTAAQIIVDDQLVTSTDTDGSVITGGNWGKTNIHLYSRTDASAPWVATGATLLETSQSEDGFYAFAINVDPTNPALANYEYTVSNSYDASGVAPEDKAISKLAPGKNYFFHTGIGEFEEDDSPEIVNVIVDRIEQSAATDSWGQYQSRTNGESFTVNFLYDTTVKTDSYGTYTIYAGAYTISKSSYKNFMTDFSGGKTGINLYSDEGKKFFSSKVLGFSTTKNTYEDWNGAISASTDDVDIMAKSIGGSAVTNVTVADDKRINFRYINEKSNDTLTLPQTINFKGGIVSMASNNIVLGGNDVVIETKTLIFYTDTIVKLADGSTYKITHGTYIFNESSSPDKSTIRLSDKDWKNHYTLVDASNTSLKGGTYVAK